MSKQRLISLYRNTPEPTILDGRQWYPIASDICNHAAKSYGVSHELFCAAVAILSPGQPWEGNVDAASTVFEHIFAYTRGEIALDNLYDAKVQTYNRNKRKAYAMIISSVMNIVPEKDSIDTFATGPKVNAFFHALNGDKDALCLDSHAINAWHGSRVAGTKLPGVPASELRRCSEDYRHAASVCGESVRDFQAIIWMRHRDRIDLGRVEGYARVKKNLTKG